MFGILNIVYFLSTFFSDIRSRDQERQGKLLTLTQEVKYLQNRFTTHIFRVIEYMKWNLEKKVIRVKYDQEKAV